MPNDLTRRLNKIGPHASGVEHTLVHKLRNALLNCYVVDNTLLLEIIDWEFTFPKVGGEAVEESGRRRATG